jgi:hypothetical protein
MEWYVIKFENIKGLQLLFWQVMFGGQRTGARTAGYMARYIASTASVIKTERNAAVSMANQCAYISFC